MSSLREKLQRLQGVELQPFAAGDLLVGVIDVWARDVVNDITQACTKGRYVRLFYKSGGLPSAAVFDIIEESRLRKEYSLPDAHRYLPFPISYASIDDIVGCVENLAARLKRSPEVIPTGAIMVTQHRW